MVNLSMVKNLDPTLLPVWQQLTQHYQQHQPLSLKNLFEHHTSRFTDFSVEAAGLLFDYSKNHLNNETLRLLLELAAACNVPQALQNLNAGASVNQSEARPALHSALRQSDHSFSYAHQDHSLSKTIQTVLADMTDFVEYVHRSHITDIVNIGIGGSNLGPVMVSTALEAYAVTSQRCHFVSTLDATQITKVLAPLDPKTTLFILSSKSFNTEETCLNATLALQWLGKERIETQCVAVTANKDAALQWGIIEKHIFPLWPWVGGRYSIWSAIGLPVAIKIGMKNFRDMLNGGACMDEHTLTAPLHENMPVMMALINLWYVNFFKAQTRAVLPYDYRLSHFPAYLQQLEMESNGKRVRQNGEAVTYETGPIIWGELETDGQHAFHQLLHQGTQLVPVDFILVKTPVHSQYVHHQHLLAHCLSQARALMIGQESSHPAKQLPGNRPSSIIAMTALTPSTLGALIALYEYKVYISAVIWGINPFDQWGVEFGKKMAEQLVSCLKENATTSSLDSSTHGLLDFLR